MTLPALHKPKPKVPRKDVSKLSPRVKKVIDAMVWDGLTADEAAKRNKFTLSGLRSAFAKPVTAAYYKQQLQILINNGRARRVHRAVEISEQSRSLQAAVAALRYLDQQVTEHEASQAVQTPGYVIVLGNEGAQQITHLSQNAPNLLTHKADVIDVVE